jgi:hypothetical protein
MNPWYMYSPFVYSDWGALHSIPFDLLIKWSWPRKIQSETAFIHWCFIEWSPYWKAGDLHQVYFICFWFVNLHQKARGICWKLKRASRTVRPRGRTVRACAESVRVPSFSRGLLPKTAGLARETVWNGSRPPPLYRWRVTTDWTPNNRSNQVYFSFLPYALGVALV